MDVKSQAPRKSAIISPNHITHMAWMNWLTGILGLWIIISPFLGFTADGMTTNLVIVGIVVAVLGFLSAGQYQSTMAHGRGRHQHA